MALSFGCWLVQDLEQIFVSLKELGNGRPGSMSAIAISRQLFCRTPVRRTASPASSPTFALPDTVCAARSALEIGVQTGPTMLARMFASSPWCGSLDSLATQRTNPL